jgi:hypothetical protein
MVHAEMEYYTHTPLINVGKAYLATHDGTIVDRYSYGFVHASIHSFFHLLACSAARADGRTMTMLPPMHPLSRCRTG